LTEQLLSHAISSRGPVRTADWYRAEEISPARARRAFRQAGLPGPCSIRRLARALHAVLALQRDPVLRVTEAAHTWGYCDHQAFALACRHYFRATATELRQFLGWHEPLRRALDLRW
jgi:AraC-like DNA-binding protein